jgi:hypothetical protein
MAIWDSVSGGRLPLESLQQIPSALAPNVGFEENCGSERRALKPTKMAQLVSLPPSISALRKVYSITSSAATSKVCGTVMPSVFAVDHRHLLVMLRMENRLFAWNWLGSGDVLDAMNLPYSLGGSIVDTTNLGRI